jgi:hypothetical protein
MPILAAPQRRLMAAVLTRAVEDHQRQVERALFAWERKSTQDAVAWVASTDRLWPFSFENICEELGVEARALRAKLRRERRL